MIGSRQDLQAQIRHQVRLTRRRMTWWITFVYGALAVFCGWVEVRQGSFRQQKA